MVAAIPSAQTGSGTITRRSDKIRISPAGLLRFCAPSVNFSLPALVICRSGSDVPRPYMSRDLNQISLQVIHALLRILLAKLIDTSHNSAADCNVNLVHVAAFIFRCLDTAVCKLFHGTFNSLIVTDCSTLYLQHGIIKCPLVSTCRPEHRSAIVEQKRHRLCKIAKCVKCLLFDGIKIGGA